MTRYRLYWWSGAGRCGGEFPSQGKIRVLSAIGGTAVRPVADCQFHFGPGDPRRVARDENYVYFTYSEGVRRQSISSTATTLLAPANGHQPGALALANGRLFWSDYDGTASRVHSMNLDGSDSRPVFVGNLPRIRRLVVGQYRAGLAYTDTLYLFHSDGRLNRFDYDTPGAAAVTLATGVFDFALRDEAVSNEDFTSIYVIVAGQTQLRSVRADNPSSSLLVRGAEGNNRFTAIAVDPKRVFLIEQPHLCSPFCVPIGYTLRSQIRPASNPDNGQIWAPITTGSGDSLVRANLRSDGQ